MRIPVEVISSAKNVINNIEGRAADGGLSLPWLGGMVAAAGEGNHLDIGSLFGASAIQAALVKKEFGLEGKVYCLDPYEPRDPALKPENMPEEQFNATPEALMRNAEKFEVELELVQKRSQPWPEELKDVTFVSAYIDGDHTGDVPWLDFQEVAKRCSGYIAFDNYEENYPEVVEASRKVLDTRDWFLFYKNNMFIAFRRTLPPRSEGTPLNVL